MSTPSEYLASLYALSGKVAVVIGGTGELCGAMAEGLAGALGASYTALCSALGMANVPYEVTLKILAPGFAEAILLLGLGLFAGAVAVIGHWALEARIDRDVLRA